eukprot:3397101-Rhodomonas_salina.1
MWLSAGELDWLIGNVWVLWERKALERLGSRSSRKGDGGWGGMGGASSGTAVPCLEPARA